MLKQFFITMFLLLGMNAYAQKPVELKLWPDGAPNSNEVTVPESKPRADRIADVSDPTLIVYRAACPNGLAIIACPGGGYSFLSMGQEGQDMAQWFNSIGVTYAVLKYRMPNFGHYEVPLTDARRAVELLRSYAGQWKISQVGIMGSSAGGHLASTLATHFTTASRPDFQILLYPVITMNADFTHPGTRKQLLGDAPKDERVEEYSNELHVTADTPPAFIMHCADDKVVPVRNSIVYFMALKEKGVSATLHIYPRGGHGFGFYDSFHYKRQWTGELEKWLAEEIADSDM